MAPFSVAEAVPPGRKKAKTGFVRPAGANPVITPDPQIRFFCPMRRDSVGWMESDTFNPAATVRDGKICVLFRAEDNSATGIGKRTSRIGLAETGDGVTMIRCFSQPKTIRRRTSGREAARTRASP